VDGSRSFWGRLSFASKAQPRKCGSMQVGRSQAHQVPIFDKAYAASFSYLGET
jgi:hypothetical protein